MVAGPRGTTNIHGINTKNTQIQNNCSMWDLNTTFDAVESEMTTAYTTIPTVQTDNREYA